jgi:hypothetical protein
MTHEWLMSHAFSRLGIHGIFSDNLDVTAVVRDTMDREGRREFRLRRTE